MPLPDNGLDVAWPPASLGAVTPKLAEWSSWYAGDVAGLESQYGAGASAFIPSVRPSQLSGGIVGSVSRFFWGSPTAPGQPRAKLHVPVASDIATASADLLFSETVAVTPPDKTPPAMVDRLQQLLEANNWDALLLEAAEVAAALGGVYLRVTWDKSVDDQFPLITAVHADSAWPEFVAGRLRAVTFWQVLDRTGDTVTRHLERHEPGRVEHGLFTGTPNRLGRRVPLTSHPATAALGGPDGVDATSGVATGYPGLTAAYVPNMRPNRRWRSDVTGSNLGRSDFDGIEPIMDAIDETWTSWMRDIRLGKSRLIVPDYMLRPTKPGQASTFNVDAEVFVGMNLPPAAEGATLAQQLTAQQFTIRTAEHAETVKALLSQAFRGAGYSGQTFGIADEATATATEVHARERRSITTREKKTRYWVDSVGAFLESVMAVDALIFSGGIVPFRPALEFPAATQPSQMELASSLQMLHAAEALSAHERVTMVHPDWDDDKVQVEVDRILNELPKPAAVVAPHPADLGQRVPVDPSAPTGPAR